ncbi:hypothetical protein BDN70DRAFT_901364 [Pholiota conissans]|uniref:Uncharacterized protein n=1 Tax=Pholiota conissans TaxID=109636 RepID=A0A9P5YM26_9AGAR|nr:hypothetical protein BDN70DRAFT_901364 [Pholiota conissans]
MQTRLRTLVRKALETRGHIGMHEGVGASTPPPSGPPPPPLPPAGPPVPPLSGPPQPSGALALHLSGSLTTQPSGAPSPPPALPRSRPAPPPKRPPPPPAAPASAPPNSTLPRPIHRPPGFRPADSQQRVIMASVLAPERPPSTMAHTKTKSAAPLPKTDKGKRKAQELDDEKDAASAVNPDNGKRKGQERGETNIRAPAKTDKGKRKMEEDDDDADTRPAKSGKNAKVVAKSRAKASLPRHDDSAYEDSRPATTSNGKKGKASAREIPSDDEGSDGCVEEPPRKKTKTEPSPPTNDDGSDSELETDQDVAKPPSKKKKTKNIVKVSRSDNEGSGVEQSKPKPKPRVKKEKKSAGEGTAKYNRNPNNTYPDPCHTCTLKGLACERPATGLGACVPCKIAKARCDHHMTTDEMSARFTKPKRRKPVHAKPVPSGSNSRYVEVSDGEKIAAPPSTSSTPVASSNASASAITQRLVAMEQTMLARFSRLDHNLARLDQMVYYLYQKNAPAHPAAQTVPASTVTMHSSAPSSSLTPRPVQVLTTPPSLDQSSPITGSVQPSQPLRAGSLPAPPSTVSRLLPDPSSSTNIQHNVNAPINEVKSSQPTTNDNANVNANAGGVTLTRANAPAGGVKPTQPNVNSPVPAEGVNPAQPSVNSPVGEVNPPNCVAPGDLITSSEPLQENTQGAPPTPHIVPIVSPAEQEITRDVSVPNASSMSQSNGVQGVNVGNDGDEHATPTLSSTQTEQVPLKTGADPSASAPQPLPANPSAPTSQPLSDNHCPPSAQPLVDHRSPSPNFQQALATIEEEPSDMGNTLNLSAAPLAREREPPIMNPRRSTRRSQSPAAPPPLPLKRKMSDAGSSVSKRFKPV